MGAPYWSTLHHSKRKREMLIMFSVFEQQTLQRPVKIAYSVYCVFDPVGNTLERRRRWNQIDFILSWEKLPYESFSDCRALSIKSVCLILPFDQLLCWNRLVWTQDTQWKSGRERREAVRKGLQSYQYQCGSQCKICILNCDICHSSKKI